MNLELLRKVLSNKVAYNGATKEVHEITLKALLESRRIIAQLDAAAKQP